MYGYIYNNVTNISNNHDDTYIFHDDRIKTENVANRPADCGRTSPSLGS